MFGPNKNEYRYPKGFCIFCSATTPHVHERLAIDRRLVTRSVCLACNREQPKEAKQEVPPP
ncbi:ribosomal protein L40E [Bradyrhizobium sp. USDA 10063]